MDPSSEYNYGMVTSPMPGDLSHAGMALTFYLQIMDPSSEYIVWSPGMEVFTTCLLFQTQY